MKYAILIFLLIGVTSIQVTAKYSSHKHKRNEHIVYCMKDTCASASYILYPDGDTMIAIHSSPRSKRDKSIIHVSILAPGVPPDTSLQPLPYANVTIRHSLIGTTTKANGEALLTLQQSNTVDTLVVSYIDYPKMQYPIRHDSDNFIKFNYGKTKPGKIIGCPIIK